MVKRIGSLEAGGKRFLRSVFEEEPQIESSLRIQEHVIDAFEEDVLAFVLLGDDLVRSVILQAVGGLVSDHHLNPS
jgi:hypothetical protein